MVVERYEAELKRYRALLFLEDDYKGVRPYSGELVEILKKRCSVDSYRLLEALGESEQVKLFPSNCKSSRDTNLSSLIGGLGCG